MDGLANPLPFFSRASGRFFSIDADALFFHNPETLFEEAGYIKTGALFFHDRIWEPEDQSRWLYDVLPKPLSDKVKTSRFWSGLSGHMQESGVALVDK